MKALKKFIENYTAISGNEWDKISQVFSQRKFAKNELILQEGMICRNFYFLESGLLRYFYNSDGKEVVKAFTFPPYCFTSEASFINQRPSIENIQALEDSIVWQTGYQQYKELENVDSWKKFTYGLLDEYDKFSKLMIIHLKTQSPEQRYFWLIQNYPQSILQRISQKDLASFLGITPQSFCRIKNNLHKNRKVNLSE
jgi:CRP/FNR family transcriptional regulator, anaerobic regulatory protein